MRNAPLKALAVVFVCLFIGWRIGAHWASNSNASKPPALPIFTLLVCVAIMMGWAALGLLAKRHTGTARQLMTWVLILSGIPVGLLITGFSLQYGVPTPGIYAARLVPSPDPESSHAGDMMILSLLIASVGNAISLIAICFALDYLRVGKSAIHVPDENHHTTNQHDW